MGRYTVVRRYRSFTDGRWFGPFEPGAVVELSTADAEWVNRDSPGTLTPFVEPQPEPTPTPEPERQAPATPNRQHKGGRNRAGG